MHHIHAYEILFFNPKTGRDKWSKRELFRICRFLGQFRRLMTRRNRLTPSNLYRSYTVGPGFTYRKMCVKIRLPNSYDKRNNLSKREIVSKMWMHSTAGKLQGTGETEWSKIFSDTGYPWLDLGTRV